VFEILTAALYDVLDYFINVRTPVSDESYHLSDTIQLNHFLMLVVAELIKEFLQFY
jgi:hypothetical protein